MGLNKTVYIALFVFVSLVVASCQQVPHRIDDDRIVASVGSRVLRVGELTAVLPLDLRGDDSVAYVDLYIDRWIARQIKVREAERIFSSSVQEIEVMVNSYRHALLTQKLDQYYINSSSEPPFSESDVDEYYNDNVDGFRLEKAVVQGVILRIPNDYDGEKRVSELMKSTKSDSRLDLVSICDKSDELSFEEFVSWIDYDEFISHLPIARDDESRVYMTKRGVQSMTDAHYTYLFEIEAYLSEGDLSPLEMVDQTIRRILMSQHEKEVIRGYEEQLNRRAMESGVVRRYLDNKSSRNSDSASHLFTPALIVSDEDLSSKSTKEVTEAEEAEAEDAETDAEVTEAEEAETEVTEQAEDAEQVEETEVTERAEETEQADAESEADVEQAEQSR